MRNKQSIREVEAPRARPCKHWRSERGFITGVHYGRHICTCFLHSGCYQSSIILSLPFFCTLLCTSCGVGFQCSCCNVLIYRLVSHRHQWLLERLGLGSSCWTWRWQRVRFTYRRRTKYQCETEQTSGDEPKKVRSRQRWTEDGTEWGLELQQRRTLRIGCCFQLNA